MSYTEEEWMEKLDKARDENHLLRVALVENIVELYRYKTALEDIVRTAQEDSMVLSVDIANTLVKVTDIAREALDCPLPDAEVGE